jgi:serine/threonine protein kinase
MAKASTVPLQAGDREQLGDYRLRGRLAETGRSVTYSAETLAGDPVVVTVYTVDLLNPDRFLTEIAALQRLPAFYTVQIVDAGTAGARPYIVTEFVDGPTLAQETLNGVLKGTALHRLAVGTITALVAIHQAGIVHGEFQPSSVILSPNGPRVTDTGIGRILEASATSVTQRIGSAAFLTPEQFGGRPDGPAADVFAWASTIVFAATGRAPFEAETMAAAMNRVLHEEPDLRMLEEPLRGLIADCLAKNPAARPTAGDALLKLVGHSLLTGRQDPVTLAQATEPGPEPPGRPEPEQERKNAGRGRYWAVLGAAGLAIALVSGGGVSLAIRSNLLPTSGAAASTPTASGVPAGSASGAPTEPLDVVSVKADPPPPPKATSRFKLTSSDVTVHENPKDAVRLTAYRDRTGTYLRTSGTTTFKKFPTPAEPVLSPDGTTLAMFTPNLVTFIDQRSNERFTINPTTAMPAGTPLTPEKPTWSPDGKRLLITLSTQGELFRPTGFLLLDVASRTTKLVDTDDDQQGEGWYAWQPNGSGVAVGREQGKTHGVVFRSLDGREQRYMDWVGTQAGGRRMFSPSGDTFLTICPSGGFYCTWATKSGVRQASISILFKDPLFAGWYDDAHLIVVDAGDARTHKYLVIDGRSRAQRVLAEVAAKDDTNDFALYFTRS